MALCMESFTDTLPIVCNGFNVTNHDYGFSGVNGGEKEQGIL